MEPYDLRWCIQGGDAHCAELLRPGDPALPPEAASVLRELDANARSAARFFEEIGLGEASDHSSLLLMANLAETNARSITLADELGGCERALRGSSLCEGRGAVLFGARRTQLAADPDIVTHELAHIWMASRLGESRWLIDAAGSSDDPVIIKEGLADFYAAVQSDDPIWGERSSFPTD